MRSLSLRAGAGASLALQSGLLGDGFVDSYARKHLRGKRSACCDDHHEAEEPVPDPPAPPPANPNPVTAKQDIQGHRPDASATDPSAKKELERRLVPERRERPPPEQVGGGQRSPSPPAAAHFRRTEEGARAPADNKKPPPAVDTASAGPVIADIVPMPDMNSACDWQEQGYAAGCGTIVLDVMGLTKGYEVITKFKVNPKSRLITEASAVSDQRSKQAEVDGAQALRLVRGPYNTEVAKEIYKNQQAILKGGQQKGFEGVPLDTSKSHDKLTMVSGGPRGTKDVDVASDNLRVCGVYHIGPPPTSAAPDGENPPGSVRVVSGDYVWKQGLSPVGTSYAVLAAGSATCSDTVNSRIMQDAKSGMRAYPQPKTYPKGLISHTTPAGNGGKIVQSKSSTQPNAVDFRYKNQATWAKETMTFGLGVYFWGPGVDAHVAACYGSEEAQRDLILYRPTWKELAVREYIAMDSVYRPGKPENDLHPIDRRKKLLLAAGVQINADYESWEAKDRAATEGSLDDNRMLIDAIRQFDVRVEGVGAKWPIVFTRERAIQQRHDGDAAVVATNYACKEGQVVDPAMLKKIEAARKGKRGTEAP